MGLHLELRVVLLIILGGGAGRGDTILRNARGLAEGDGVNGVNCRLRGGIAAALGRGLVDDLAWRGGLLLNPLLRLPMS